MDSTDERTSAPLDDALEITEWIPAATAAQRMGVQPRTLRGWCEGGHVPYRTAQGEGGLVALVDIGAAEAYRRSLETRPTVPSLGSALRLDAQTDGESPPLPRDGRPDMPQWVSELANAWKRAAKAEAEVEAFKDQLADIARGLEVQEAAARAAQEAVINESRQAVRHAAHAAHAAHQAAAEVTAQAEVLARDEAAVSGAEDALQ
ncbi:MAG: hypothetical protein M3277_08100, partial [Actinomycetota bacterium]|nr:hypothetical protein [Actinomycetota bacterium]